MPTWRRASGCTVCQLGRSSKDRKGCMPTYKCLEHVPGITLGVYVWLGHTCLKQDC